MKVNVIITLAVLAGTLTFSRPITDDVATKETIEQYAKYYEQIAAQRAKYLETYKSQFEYTPEYDYIAEKAVVKIVQKTVSPIKYNLYQNYPNPFNPSTVIKFDISSKSKVDLKIYDILGKEIAVLINETKEPGSYLINFDGSNLSSGIYFCTLSQDGNSITKKMTLIK